MQALVIALACYLAIGVAVLGIARTKLTAERWWHWGVIIIGWPAILIPLLRGY